MLGHVAPAVWPRATLCVADRPEVHSSACQRHVSLSPAGVSLGGMITWLTAAADPRVTAAAPLIGVQSFAWALQHDAWHARVDSIPLVFKVAAADMGRKEVGGEHVQGVLC